MGISKLAESVAGVAERRAATTFINPHGEPQRAYMWEWEINGLKSELQFGNLAFYTKSIELPERQLTTIQSQYLGRKINYVSEDDSEKSIDTVLWDDEDLKSLRFFDGWINHMNTPNLGGGVRKSKYVADIKIHLKNSFDLFTVLTVHLENAFPYARSKVDLSYENNEIMEYTVSIAYDTFYLNGQEYEQLGNIPERGGLVDQAMNALL